MQFGTPEHRRIASKNRVSCFMGLLSTAASLRRGRKSSAQQIARRKEPEMLDENRGKKSNLCGSVGGLRSPLDIPTSRKW